MKKNMFLFLLIALFFSFTSLFSQEAFVLPETAIELPNGLYLLEDGREVDPITGLEPHRDYEVRDGEFFQTIAWEPIENAYRYEVLIERQDDTGLWASQGLYPSEIEMAEVEVSLLSGIYRYKIVVYNFLDIAEGETDWFDLEIFEAVQPSVVSISPDLLYLDEAQSGVFNFRGSDFSKETVFSLEIPGIFSKKIIGEIIEQNGDNFRIQFPPSKIDVGKYVFKTENRGGLTDEVGPIVVRFLKPYDLNVTVGYNMFYNFPGEISHYLKREFYPFGASAKITYIPLKRNWGQIGFELSGYWYLMSNEFETYAITSHVIPATLNFVYQYPIVKKRFILDTHVGLGTTIFTDMKFEFSNGIVSPSQNVLGLTANAGLAFQLYVSNRLYVELGADYLFTLFQGTMLHLVTPAISVGWQF